MVTRKRPETRTIRRQRGCIVPASKVLCSLDTSNLKEARELVRKLSPYVGGFKIGHALTLPHGLDVVRELQDSGANRVFLDLKFHDIPNVIGLAVREACKAQVWMLTMHLSGGPAMIAAAVEEASSFGDEYAPLLMGVSVLTSLDQHILSDHLGIARSLSDQMAYLSQLGVELGLDGVISSPAEVAHLRQVLGSRAIIVAPGIRAQDAERDDQMRVGTAVETLERGADYLVIGRALTTTSDPVATLHEFGLLTDVQA